MSRLITALVLLALTGCTFCEKHPKTCLFAATCTALSVPALTHTSHRGTTGTDGHDVTTQPFTCTGASCL